MAAGNAGECVNKQIAQKRAYLKQENEKWPESPIEVPRDKWHASFEKLSADAQPCAVFRSKWFLVQLFPARDGGQRITVSRTTIDQNGEWHEGVSWDALQEIKRAIGFGRFWAVEIFPPDSSVVNVANMRHLWVIPEAPEFAWNNSDQEEVGK